MLEIKNISFAYNQKKVLNNLDFQVTKGQNLAIIGESGCGKSTLLKLIYGLYDLGEGEILYDKNAILGPKYKLIPGEDFIKYLAQDFDLMPFVTVGENVGKFLSNVFKDKKQERILELLQIVEMTEFVSTKAKFLSGGQMQRVAIARVLALEPEILLLDEPFSHIDNFRKNALRRNLFAYLKQKNITCIVATHDSSDVLSFSDETIVLQDGKILIKGNSHDIYNNPSSKYIASLYGEVTELKWSEIENIQGDDKMILLYSHQLKMTENGLLKVAVKKSYFRGNHYLIEAVLDDKPVFFENKFPLDFGEKVSLSMV